MICTKTVGHPAEEMVKKQILLVAEILFF